MITTTPRQAVRALQLSLRLSNSVFDNNLFFSHRTICPSSVYLQKSHHQFRYNRPHNMMLQLGTVDVLQIRDKIGGCCKISESQIKAEKCSGQVSFTINFNVIREKSELSLSVLCMPLVEVNQHYSTRIQATWQVWDRCKEGEI